MSDQPPAPKGFRPSNKPVVLRAQSLQRNGATDEHLQSALRGEITARLEEGEKATVDFTVDIVSSCYDAKKRIGLVDCRGKVPAFLKPALDKPPVPPQIDAGELRGLTFDCNFSGLTQLYNTSGDISADIIAITGLAGHAYGSWRGKAALSSMWLREFLPNELPNCRVMTYGYNSSLIGGNPGLHKIKDYVKDLLEQIKQVRSGEEEMRRPLIFIGHSFGGIVLSHTLVKAKESRNPKDNKIYAATYGMLSSAPRTKIGEGVRPLLDHLENFINCIDDRKIVSFYEAEQTQQAVKDLKTGKFRRAGDYVTAVSVKSAVLGLPDSMEETFPLSADHSMMVKFDSTNDEGYRHIIVRLLQFTKDAPQTIEARFGPRNDKANAKATPSQPSSASAQGCTGLEPAHNTAKEWTKTLSSCLPSEPSMTQEKSIEFKSHFRQLNSFIANIRAADDRVAFRTSLEADGQISDVVARARVIFEEYNQVIKELDNYEDD